MPLKFSDREAWAKAGRSILLVALLGGGQTAVAADAPKTHVLFMGVNLALEREGKVRPVVDVGPYTITTHVDGEKVDVPQAPGLTWRITENLKLASERVSVDGLSVERAYTPENDPFQAFQKGAAIAAGQADVESLAHGQLTEAHTMRGFARGPGIAEAEQRITNRSDSYDKTLMAGRNDLYSVANHAARFGVKNAEEPFDAIRMKFDVTAARDLARPFFVVVVQLRERDAKPNAIRKWVYAKSMSPLAAGEKQTIHVYQGGFPIGYRLEDHSVHLFDQGIELATNISRKRVELTAEEAIEYQVIEYVAAHKGQTLGASPVMSAVPSLLREQLVAGHLSETYFVRVAKDGKVMGAYRDAEGKRPLDDAKLESMLRSIRFKPALQNGRPVEAIAPLKLGALTPL